MYYRIRKDKKDELQGGRTITYLADICGCSRVFLSYTFNGYEKRKTTKQLAEKIISEISKESVSVNRKVQELGIGGALDYYFEKIK